MSYHHLIDLRYIYASYLILTNANHVCEVKHYVYMCKLHFSNGVGCICYKNLGQTLSYHSET